MSERPKYSDFVTPQVRGMQRAIGIVGWMKAFAEFEAAQYPPDSLVASAFQQQAANYESVLNALRGER